MELMAIQINYNATVLSRFVQSNVSKIIRSVLVLQRWADMCVLPHTIYLCCTKAEVNLTLISYKLDVESQMPIDQRILSTLNFFVGKNDVHTHL